MPDSGLSALLTRWHRGFVSRHARQQAVFDIRAKLARSLATCFPNRVRRAGYKREGLAAGHGRSRSGFLVSLRGYRTVAENLPCARPSERARQLDSKFPRTRRRQPRSRLRRVRPPETPEILLGS